MKNEEIDARLMECRSEQVNAVGLDCFNLLVIKLAPIIDLFLMKSGNSLYKAFYLIEEKSKKRSDSEILIPLLNAVLYEITSNNNKQTSR
jgi:hypothetical protein